MIVKKVRECERASEKECVSMCEFVCVSVQ